MEQNGAKVTGPVTITGLVIPREWDPEGRVTAVALATFDEVVYPVQPGARALPLKKLVGHEVALTGMVMSSNGETSMIAVEKVVQVARPGAKKMLSLAVAVVGGAALILGAVAPVSQAAETVTPPAVATQEAKPQAKEKMSQTEAPAPAKATKQAAKKSVKKSAKKKAGKQWVMAVQKALNDKGFAVKVDGMMGKETRKAVKEFQKQNGIKATGKVGKATKAKLGLG